MGQLGDMFPGAKLQKDAADEAGTGQAFEPGPLDLDGGVIRLRSAQPTRPASEPVADED